MAAIEHPVAKEPDSAVADLSAVLLAGLKALGDAGEADLACRLAGRACAVLRRTRGDEWRRYNTLLHRLARRTGPVGAAVHSNRLEAMSDPPPPRPGLSKN